VCDRKKMLETVGKICYTIWKFLLHQYSFIIYYKKKVRSL